MDHLQLQCVKSKSCEGPNIEITWIPCSGGTNNFLRNNLELDGFKIFTPKAPPQEPVNNTLERYIG